VFGDRYRVEHELGGKRISDPWHAVIRCKHGHVYPCGGSLLGVATTHRGPIAHRLAALDFVTVVQDGEDGINAVFDVASFAHVAEIIKPRRRRRLSAKHRDKLIAASRPFRFSGGSNDADKASESHENLKPTPQTKKALELGKSLARLLTVVTAVTHTSWEQGTWQAPVYPEIVRSESAVTI